MDLFRRKQKFIFWIVAIIIIPSFVLVWGVNDRRTDGGYADMEVGSIDGKSLKYHEFENFRRRLGAALGGAPLQFTNAPGAGTPGEDLYKYVFAYALLQDAEKAGVTASDLQIGTYIENGHPIIAPAIKTGDPQSKERAVDNLCRQMQISRQDFVRGVREWQTIGNYMQADANLASVNDEAVFSFYSLNRAECVIKRIHFAENEGIKAQAKQEIMATPEDELERLVRDHIAANSDDPRFREPAQWRFAYIFTPFVNSDTVRALSDAEIRERYEANRASLYENKPLGDVMDRVRADLVREEIERQTNRNFSVDVDPRLIGDGATMDPAEVVKLTPLPKLGVIAGDTGPELKSAADILTSLPKGSDIRLALFLGMIDTSPEEARTKLVDEWKGGYNIESRPYVAENGLFRMRLLDYQPSTPAAVDTDEGKVKPDLYEKALSDLVGRRAAEIVKADADEMEQKLRAYLEAKEKGEPVPDPEMAAEFEAMPTTTVTYLEITQGDNELLDLAIGELLGPLDYRDPESGDRGQEIIVMVNRRVPTREQFAAEPDNVKNAFRQIATVNFQGNYGFTYDQNGPSAVIQPSPTIMAGIADRYNKGAIRVNPELLRQNEG